MKATYLLVVIALFLQAPASEGQRWWSHVEYLAADSLEGRRIGTPGFEQAVAYVERQFEEIGLTPGGTSSYRQAVRLESRVVAQEQSKLALVRDGREVAIATGEEASLSARGQLEGAIEAPLVFVGYGLSIPEAGWDELGDLDLRGKIAVYVNMPAPVDVGDAVRSHVGSAAERWARLRSAGAIGIATLPRVRRPAADATEESTERDDAAATPAVRPAAAPTIVLAESELQDSAGMSVAINITRRGADAFFAGSGHTWQELERLVLERKPLPRFPLVGTLRAEVALKRTPIASDNVVGVLEGSDPRLKSEHVVMSAHLDHIGIGRPVNGDAIYNGAMDDASGVASMIEIARMMKKSTAPKRSILFIAVTAEESGLLGSKYFVARPTVPAGSIVANVNLDMFLPLYPLRVIEVQGLAESSLGESVRAAAKELGVDVQSDREPEENRFVRSDQYSFIRRGIPALAFKFGYEAGSPEEKIRREWVRTVYHKPNDDLKQPVDLDAAALFNRVIAGLLRRVANDAARPTWAENSFFKRFSNPD